VGVSREGRASIDGMTELTRANSNFGRLQVLQTGDGRRYYLNDFLTQNTYDPAEKKSISLFTAMLHGLAHAYTPQVKDVLCIGMGVGIVPMQFVNEGAQVDVVEINPAVVPLAQAHFDLQPDRFNLVIGDGRYFINRATKQYDAIILDAFLGDSSPSHLMTREAFVAMQRILRAEGVLVINSFGDFDRDKDFLTASLDRTLKAVFRSVRIHASGNGNVFFVASNQPELNLLHPPNLELAHPLIRHQITDAFASIQLVNPRHGRVLTDDFNPVDFYDAANRETIRRSLAASMRQR
jgi:spermidine synthase